MSELTLSDLKNENATLRAALQRCLTLLAAGAGDDSPEYIQACAIVATINTAPQPAVDDVPRAERNAA